MALTRWKITQPGICYLESFSEGFASLISHRHEHLSSCFTCVQMYTPREYSSTIKFLELLGSCRVESLSVRVPILRGTGEIIPVVSMISVEFIDGIPQYASICMNRFDVKEDIPYWEPFDVKLRSLESLWHNQQHQRTSPEPKAQISYMNDLNVPNYQQQQNQMANVNNYSNYTLQTRGNNFPRERNCVLLDFSNS